MRTVVLGQRPVELEQMLERRRALGQDGHDEIWEGDYHVAPFAHSRHGLIDDELAAWLRPWGKRAGLIGSGAFNLGSPDDFRVPDRAFHRVPPTTLYVASAPVVIEIVSPDDETFHKFDFYAAHGVQEILVALPEERVVHCYDLTSPEQRVVAVSAVLGVDLAELSASLAWPEA